MRWPERVARTKDRRATYRFGEKSLRLKTPRGRPRRAWNSNIKVNLLGIWWGWACGLG
jgi:hypothetical protein